MVEFNMNFMKHWNDLTPVEIRGTDILKKGMEIVFDNIPKKNIISIYLKGSFLRREMNENSDVDVVVILNDEKYFKILKELREK